MEKARRIQQDRFKDDDQVSCNVKMTTTMIQKYCKLDDKCLRLLKNASEKYGYSAQVIHKLLWIARTSADFDAAENISKEDVIQLLSLETELTYAAQRNMGSCTKRSWKTGAPCLDSHQEQLPRNIHFRCGIA